jgi:adenylosuccinate lyase
LALIHYRIKVELLYLKALTELPLPQLSDVPRSIVHVLDTIDQSFSREDGEEIKAIEKTTNHDVKAVEYFIKKKLTEAGFERYIEFVHFGLTSQDINNTAIPWSLKEAMENEVIPLMSRVLSEIKAKARAYEGVAMLARTHGQAASPTTLGKEMEVFAERLENILAEIQAVRIRCKFGGATGNFNAHKVSYPDIDWPKFADTLTEKMGLKRSTYTTQIAHYDDLAALCQGMSRFNTCLIDFARDIWTYISMDYFKQKTIAGEVGSSAMPHKVNPIDFENAEGNLGMANAVFGHLAEKLPISRLQRDLTDSTVLRNLGVPFGHCMIAYRSLLKGLDKLILHEEALRRDLENNWAVVAEAIQNILRREMYPQPYEALKDLTRGKDHVTRDDIHDFIRLLDIRDEVKEELLAITPWNYTGYVVYG